MKRYKKVLTVTLALIMAIAVFNGCKKKDDVTTPPADTQTPPLSSNGESTDKEGVWEEYINVLGKTDEEVKDLFNGGTANYSEDNKTVLGRSYKTDILGENVPVETIYDEEGKVVNINISFEKADYDTVRKKLQETFGEPEKVDNTAELDSKYLTFKKDKTEVVLNDSYGYVGVQMTLGK